MSAAIRYVLPWVMNDLLEFHRARKEKKMLGDGELLRLSQLADIRTRLIGSGAPATLVIAVDREMGKFFPAIVFPKKHKKSRPKSKARLAR